MAAAKRDLWRSKSTGFLDQLKYDIRFNCFSGRLYSYNNNVGVSVASIEECSAGSGLSAESKRDSGFQAGVKSSPDGETLLVLEQKVDRLNELLQIQHRLLMDIKEDVMITKAETRSIIAGNVSSGQSSDQELLTNETNKIEKINETSDDGDTAANSPARSLLDAIQVKQNLPLEQIIRTALENFLESDELKARVAAATAMSVSDALGGDLYRPLANANLLIAEKAHGRLLQQVTKMLHRSFSQLERSCGSMFKAVHRTSRNLHEALERHELLLEAAQPAASVALLRTTLRGVLEEELRAWRSLLTMEMSSPEAPSDDCDSESPIDLESPAIPASPATPASPLQPVDPNKSAIDTLMKCALINKHIADGDVDGAFDVALTSADLVVVMGACRAVEPRRARALRPELRLSLLQQLATDMVHDTQLKCRYLEEVIISLSSEEKSPALPLAAREARSHLANFLRAYPKHHDARRVALIVMAANNLLK